MDKSLEDIISETRPSGRGGARGGGQRGDRRPPPRAPQREREEYPRDGVRKTLPQYRRDERSNIDSDWVHDRFEDDRYERAQRRAPYEEDRHGPPRAHAQTGTRIRVENLHYELTEDDLRELFERIGPIVSVRLLYDRADRSQGTAFVTYEDYQDARQAVTDFDGCNANGQPIYLTLAPAGGAASKGSLLDRAEPRPRSLFERIESNGGDRRRRERSDSPRRNNSRLAPPDVDRYMPGRDSRSPIGRRGGGGAGRNRDGGRRPGAKREAASDAAGKGTGNAGGRRARTDDDGRPMVGGRPRKTAEELDAEMADYWANKNDDSATGATNGSNGGVAPVTGDVEMDIID